MAWTFRTSRDLDYAAFRLHHWAMAVAWAAAALFCVFYEIAGHSWTWSFLLSIVGLTALSFWLLPTKERPAAAPRPVP